LDASQLQLLQQQKMRGSCNTNVEFEEVSATTQMQHHSCVVVGGKWKEFIVAKHP